MENNHTSNVIIAKDTSFIPEFMRLPYAGLAFKKGDGVWLEDHDGNRYIDFMSSASSANLGHGNRRLAEAVFHQMSQLSNYTVYFYTEPVSRLAQLLSTLAPGDFPKKVAFGLSGSDSIDGMIKLVRAYTGRSKIISFVGSYHGSTLGAISLSAISPQMRRKIGPLVPDIHHFQYPACYRCPFGNKNGQCSLECLEQLTSAFESYLPPDEVAAVVIEPIAGDAGLVVPPQEFMSGLKTLCEAQGILFVVDEIQQGLGRTGKWFSIEHFGIEPDILVLGKSLGGGLPMSAIIGRAEIMNSLCAPAHVFTMSGNAAVAAAALEQITIIQEQNLLQNVSDMGTLLRSKLSAMRSDYPFIGDIRGLGLSIGVDLIHSPTDRTPNRDAAIRISHQCIQSGLVQIYVGKSTLRIQPPFILNRKEMDMALVILEDAFRMYREGLIGDGGLDCVKGW